MSRARLFEEFPPVSTAVWEEQIRTDLRGEDYGETLLWHLPDGFTVRPYYRSEDVSALERPESEDDRETVEVPVRWRLRQDIRTPDLEAAARHAGLAIDAGVDVLGIDLRIGHNRCAGVPLLQRKQFQRFLEDLPLSDVELHLEGGVLSPGLMGFYLDYVEERGPAAAFSLGFDPIAEATRRGRRLDHLLDLSADMIRVIDEESVPNARVLALRSGVYHNAGATPIQEVALLLSAVSEIIVEMIDRGVHAEQVFGRLSIETSIGSTYFVEIARLRALRILLRRLVDVFVPSKEAPLPPIHGETSIRNKTLYDPHENLLRSTTEAASAVIGGCDVVVIHPFDDISGLYDEFSYRMARNIQHILRFEGGFDRVADPAAGSYYVEVLTDGIARRAWQLFQDIESRGGFFEALQTGFVHEQLEASAAEERMAVAERRTILVGTNHYPNLEERRSGEIVESEGIGIGEGEGEGERTAASPALFDEVRRQVSIHGLHALASLSDGPTLGPPLSSERLAEPVEQRRLRTERHERDLRILLAPFGDPATRTARSNFAASFLGCGGFRIEAPLAFTDVGAVARAVLEMNPDVVVYCADDQAYPDLLGEVESQLDRANMQIIRGIVAAPEVMVQLDDRDYDFSIHRGSHLLDVIDDLHRRLGVVHPIPFEPDEARATGRSPEAEESSE